MTRYMIETVYIYPGISKEVQMNNAREKAKRHPHGFANVCFHKYGEAHVKECYTLDINAKEKTNEETKTV